MDFRDNLKQPSKGPGHCATDGAQYLQGGNDEKAHIHYSCFHAHVCIHWVFNDDGEKA